MRLTPLAERAFARLDERLSRTSQRAIALGLSGGGDSTALALIAADWCARVRRPLLILTVDHRLQAASAGWTAHCRDLAGRLGADFRALAWTGEKPATGLPAAARAARHRLLADAARHAGAQVLLLGHTADDVMEAQAMRADGATTPDPRPWSPSPAWPQGRGLFILRPLLEARREAIRAVLRETGETWIDDPANTDMTYARPRARAAMAADAAPEIQETPASAPAFDVDQAGVITIARRAVDWVFLGRAVVCAGGGTRPPSRARLEALIARLATADVFTANLAGAAVVAEGEMVQILREPGEAARGGLAPVRLAPGERAVWDGRFEIQAGGAELEVRRLAGAAASLSRRERDALRVWPPRVRHGLPRLAAASGAGSLLAPPVGAVVRELISERLGAALGFIQREPD